ncbi:hypothetical protein EG329_013501 [Mollisiaceae sp. DMI_Dod_QoI]|nr:hypothetical protein EG329_013501 [Helotiales sp. DMI_Dod_QoI]
MGNRFAGLPQYHQLIKGHGILAVITFLFIVPSAILIAAFYGRSPFWALRMHIYLQILTVALTTVIFTLGWFAVGPERSLTNPHHGIGLAIYVLVLWQAITGWWIHRRERGRGRRRLPVKLVLHQWLGRATALLGFAQVPLGLTLYGSPKFTFVLYSLWMFFLLLLFFILSYRAQVPIDAGVLRSSSHGGTVMEDKKPSRFGGLLGPLAAGAGAAALLSSRRNRNRSRSRSRSRVEVIPSRTGSRRGSRRDSYIEEEKYESGGRRRDDKKGGGMMDTLLKGAAVLGVAGLAKSWYDGRKRRREEDTYSSVAPDTPSRRHDRRRHSDSSESVEVHRMEEGRTHRPILPGPGDPVVAAAAMSAAGPRPTTPRPVRPGARRDSYDSDSYYDYDSTLSPSRRPQSTHKVRNGVLAGLGVGWFAKKMKERRDKKEADRVARLEEERIEDERRARRGQTPQRLTGDGFPTGRHGRRGSRTQSSDLSSVIDNPHDVRPGAIPPIPAAFAAGTGAGAAGAAINQSQSRHDITQNINEPVAMPPIPHDPQGILHQESGSESYMSPGGHPHRRHSERRRREGEAAMAAAAGAAATLAAEEERRRHRSQSRHEGSNVASPPVSVKVKVHDDKDRHVTLRRLTEQEAAAEREARRSERHRRRADSVSSLSGTDTAASRRRYRRDEREAERRAETSVLPPPPPPMAPLSPPNPAFAGGRRPKDSAYYSGRPGEPSASGTGIPAPSIGTPESHATWSAMSPDVSTGDGAEAAAERRRRRRLERNARNHPSASGTTDYN